MEIEKLFVSLAVDAAEYVSGLNQATSGGVSWASDWGKRVSSVLSTAFLAGVTIVTTSLATIGSAAFGVANEVQGATVNIQSQLGATGEEAERLGNIAADVWGNNFAGSIGEAGNALVLVKQQLGDLPDDALQSATENAFRLADTFGTDVSENIHTAGVLMNEFGLTQEEAFDLITSGFQRGLNSSDDFIDSINEYSNLFADTGFSADQMFSIMETGLAGGVLGTDKISDAIKEMTLRLNEGGDDVSDAFQQIGLDFDEIQSLVASGGADWADYFDDIASGLSEIEDPIQRQQAQVAIFGTMAEDLGVSFTDGLSSAQSAIEDMSGATAALDVRYNTLGDVVEGFRRRAILALEPIGVVLLDLANRIMPLVDAGFSFFETSIIPAIQTVTDVVSMFIANLEEGMTPLNAFIEAIWGIAPPEVLAFLVQLRDEILPQLVIWFTENVQPIIDMVAGFVSWNDVLVVLAGAIVAIVLPALVSLIASIATIALPITAAIAIVALLRNAWENNWGGIQEKTAAVIAFVQNIITTVMTAIQEFWTANGDAILAKANEIWTTIQTVINTAITTISNIVTSIMTAIQAFWAANGDAILAKASEIWTAIWTTITNIITSIQADITNIATAIQAFWTEHGEAILATASQIWDAILEYINGTWETIKALFAAFKAAFEGDWRGFGENLRAAWESHWNTAVEFLSTIWPMVSGWLQSFKDNVFNWFSSIDWASLGENIVDSLANSIRSGVGAVADAARELASNAWDAISGFFEFGSPSKLMIRAAGWIVQPVIDRLSKTADVEQAATKFAMASNPLDRVSSPAVNLMANGSNTSQENTYIYNNNGSQPRDPQLWFEQRRRLARIAT